MTNTTPNLNDLAQQLADAKAQADAAKAAYDALLDNLAIKAAADAKKQADADLKGLEAQARDLLASKHEQGVTITSAYYDVQTSVEPDYTGKELVEHLITQAPALALGLLKVDEKALGKLISANAIKQDGLAGWPDYLRHAMAPVKLNVTPKPRIMWSKLPKATDTPDAPPEPEPATVAPVPAADPDIPF